MLSKTTTTSAAASFGTESEASEQGEEEANYEIEFSGECGECSDVEKRICQKCSDMELCEELSEQGEEQTDYSRCHSRRETVSSKSRSRSKSSVGTK